MAGVVRLVSKIGIATVVALAAVSGSAMAATSTTDRPDPRELWNAYPLEPGQGTPTVRLPADSAPPARAPAQRADGGGGGAGSSVAVLLGVALLALVVGAVGGMRARRSSRSAPAPRPAPAAPRAATPPAPPPTRAPSEPIPTPSPNMASTSPAAPPPTPAPPSPPPAPPPTPASPSPPSPASAPPRATTPRAQPPAQPPPPAARRFQRVPWPDGAEGRWRCEVASHFGVLHADFRALAFEPGKRRPVAYARTRAYTRPGWGSEPSYEKQSAMVGELVAALRRAGWEPVGLGREWFAARFVWSRSGAPDLDEFPDPISAKERVDVR